MSTPFLLFQLYGPLASWGDIAVGEVRPSADRPSKSAVLGLVAAALGLRRDQEDAHRQLADSLRFALRLENPGTYLHDYHTVQIPEGKGARGLPTRKDELAYDKVGTLLSYRDYYAGQYAIVCLWKTSDADPPLEAIAEHLRHPRFQLYLGRKSCPPALPLAPVVVEATSVREALGMGTTHYGRRVAVLLRNVLRRDSSFFERQRQVRSARDYWEGTRSDYDGNPNESVLETERWDQPGSRTRWQFQPRREYMTTVHRHD